MYVTSYQTHRLSSYFQEHLKLKKRRKLTVSRILDYSHFFIHVAELTATKTEDNCLVLKIKIESLTAYYSQTGCSFPRNFANFRRDNLQLARSICNRAGRSRRANSSTKMFQVLVQYLGDRYVSIYVDKAIDDYHELLEGHNGDSVKTTS